MTNRLSGWVKAGVILVSVALCLGGISPAFSEEQKCPESDSGLSLPERILRDNLCRQSRSRTPACGDA